MSTSKYSSLTPQGQCLVDEQVKSDVSQMEESDHPIMGPNFQEKVREGLSSPETVARLKTNAEVKNANARKFHVKSVNPCVP